MRARCAVVTSTGDSSRSRYRRPSSAMPRSQRSAAAMAILWRGGVERRRRLESPGLARVHLADGLERVPQEPVDQRQPILGDCDARDANAFAHFIGGDVRIPSGHGGASRTRVEAILQAPPRIYNARVPPDRYLPPAITSSCRSDSAAVPMP